MSRPSRARGLKHRRVCEILLACQVAPLTGAWIETSMVGNTTKNKRTSRPSRARGLKHLFGLDPNIQLSVAPLTGAWIETSRPSGSDVR